MSDDLSPDERAALDAYEAPAVPAGFADRVLAAAELADPATAASRSGAPPVAATASSPAPSRRRFAWIALGAIAAAGVGFVVARGRAHESSGAVVADDRRRVEIGDRAIAIAEAGTGLAWHVSDGAVRVEQPSGESFYRVDHGGPFVVDTPLGEVRVTGTCFRIEVVMKPSKSSLKGGAIGAAIAAALVVTVYEGGVVVAGRHGSSTQIAAGERATIPANGAPVVGSAAGSSIATPTADVTPPTTDITREQLLARDEQQRLKITALATRVNDLERQITERGGQLEPADGRPWFDPSPETLASYAKNCEIRMDMPAILQTSAPQIDDHNAAESGVADADRAKVNAALGELHKTFAERIRVLYIAVIGEGADQNLSAQAMIQELQDKSVPGEVTAIRTRIAQERAGLAQPPADWSHAPPVERMMRLMAGLGDETEKLLASKIGPDAAHALRMKNNGWGSKWSMSGCEDPH